MGMVRLGMGVEMEGIRGSLITKCLLELITKKRFAQSR